MIRISRLSKTDKSCPKTASLSLRLILSMSVTLSILFHKTAKLIRKPPRERYTCHCKCHKSCPSRVDEFDVNYPCSTLFDGCIQSFRRYSMGEPRRTTSKHGKITSNYVEAWVDNVGVDDNVDT